MTAMTTFADTSYTAAVVNDDDDDDDDDNNNGHMDECVICGIGGGESMFCS